MTASSSRWSPTEAALTISRRRLAACAGQQGGRRGRGCGRTARFLLGARRRWRLRHPCAAHRRLEARGGDAGLRDGTALGVGHRNRARQTDDPWGATTGATRRPPPRRPCGRVICSGATNESAQTPGRRRNRGEIGACAPRRTCGAAPGSPLVPSSTQPGTVSAHASPNPWAPCSHSPVILPPSSSATAAYAESVPVVVFGCVAV
jgi:hypothetical protein